MCMSRSWAFLHSNVFTSTRHRICRCCHDTPQSGKMACLMNLGLKHILGKLGVVLIVDENGRSNWLSGEFETCPSQTKNPNDPFSADEGWRRC